MKSVSKFSKITSRKLKSPKIKQKPLGVKISIVGNLEVSFPFGATELMRAYSQASNGKSMGFAVDRLPVTVNSGYEYNMGKKIRFLTKEAKEFRTLVDLAIGTQKVFFRPVGAISTVIFLESPRWLTNEPAISVMDVDNRVKPLIDAIKVSIGRRDEQIWNLHVFKVPSPRERTLVYLYDLGDEIQFFG